MSHHSTGGPATSSSTFRHTGVSLHQTVCPACFCVIKGHGQVVAARGQESVDDNLLLEEIELSRRQRRKIAAARKTSVTRTPAARIAPRLTTDEMFAFCETPFDGIGYVQPDHLRETGQTLFKLQACRTGWHRVTAVREHQCWPLSWEQGVVGVEMHPTFTTRGQWHRFRCWSAGCWGRCRCGA
jgi:hypothetical protein